MNEIYQYYETKEESQFEITTKYIKSGQTDIIDQYAFSQSQRDIKVVDDPTDPNSVLIQWS